MHEKIRPFTGVTRQDYSADQVLEMAAGKLRGCLVIGFDKDGRFYGASSYADGGSALWLVEVYKKLLLEAGQGSV